MLKLRDISLLSLLVVLLFSCNSYQKIVKSSNMELKYIEAKKYYDKGKFDKAMPLFEELITVYKGNKSIDEVYYLFARCHYELGNYIIAAFHFKNIHDSYPLSPYAEECLYMNAYCTSLMSAEVALDQTYTIKGIDAYQLFVNSYPDSKHIEESNRQMTILRRKLELKSMSAAELYYKIGHYKAAAVSFNNLLKQFPDTKDAERVHFLIIKAYYMYAVNSIAAKQEERYNQTLTAYSEYMAKHGAAGVYQKDAQKIFESTQNKIKKLKQPNNNN